MRKPTRFDCARPERRGRIPLRSAGALAFAALMASSSPLSAIAEERTDLQTFRVVVQRLQRFAETQDDSPVAGEAQTRGDLSRIIEGEPATIAEWPSFVRVQARLSSGAITNCGGALVGRQWVLTAGHCVEGDAADSFTIIEGVDDLRANGRMLRVDRVILNDGFFRDRHDAPHNDIALLHLTSPAQARIQRLVPKSLVESAAHSGASVSVAGFGLTIPQTGAAAYQGPRSNRLLQVSLPVVARSECARILARALNASPTDPSLVDETNLCAGDPARGGRDSCNGDSGGPLVTELDGRRAQVGVVSWGAGCGQKGTVGVYTSVGYFESWIRRYVTDADFAPAEGLVPSPAPTPTQPPRPVQDVSQPCDLPPTPPVTTVRLDVAEGDRPQIGAAIHIRATPTVSGQLLVFNVDLQTCRVFQVFPNQYTLGAKVGVVVDAGETVSIPGSDDAFVLRVGAPTGANRLYALIVPADVRIDDLASQGADMRALANAPALWRQLLARARASSSGQMTVEAVGVHDYEIVH